MREHERDSLVLRENFGNGLPSVRRASGCAHIDSLAGVAAILADRSSLPVP